MREAELNKILDTEVKLTKRQMVDVISTFVAMELKIKTGIKLEELRVRVFHSFNEYYEDIFPSKHHKKFDC